MTMILSLNHYIFRAYNEGKSCCSKNTERNEIGMGSHGPGLRSSRGRHCHHSSSFGLSPPSPSGDDVIYEQPLIEQFLIAILTSRAILPAELLHKGQGRRRYIRSTKRLKLWKHSKEAKLLSQQETEWQNCQRALKRAVLRSEWEYSLEKRWSHWTAFATNAVSRCAPPVVTLPAARVGLCTNFCIIYNIFNLMWWSFCEAQVNQGE